MSLADDLISLARAVAPANVPGVPGVCVRLLTVSEMLALFRDKERGDVLAVLYGACDPTGARIFADGEDARVEALDFRTATLIRMAVFRHNNLLASGEEVEGEGKAGRTP